jgi:hypothetical protein
MGKPRLLAGAFLISIFSIAGGVKLLCNEDLFCFVLVDGIWGLTWNFAGEFWDWFYKWLMNWCLCDGLLMIQ